MFPLALRARVRHQLKASGYNVVPFTRPRLLAHHGVTVLLDVGASEGLYAEEMRRLGFNGRIVSFEPRADAFERLRARAASDPTWDVVPLALGAEAGTSTIHISGAGDSSSLLAMLPRHTAVRPDTAYVADQPVTVDTLDAVFNRYVRPGDVPFLKMDVQGYERHVLDGATASIKRLIGLQLELSLVPLYDGETLFHDMVERLAASGFRLMAFEPTFHDPNAQQLLQADGLFFRSE